MAEVQNSNRRYLVTIVILSFALCFCIFKRNPVPSEEVDKAECRHEATIFKCVKYVRNYDADTITVNIPGIHPLLGKDISVRVLGIDAPEIRGKESCEKQKALAARDYVKNILTHSAQIELHNVQRDKYFRILGDVIVDGKDLKDLLMHEGLVQAYDGGSKKNIHWCQPSGKRK